MKDIEIAGRPIGPGRSPYVIAELSGNHNGELGRAIEILEAAVDAGADAVKLQTYTADTITIRSDRPEFRIRGGLWDGHTLYELYDWAHTPWDWHGPLIDRGRELGVAVFSSPFDPTAVDYLVELEAPAYKVASFEIVDLPLIQLMAATGKPVIMSTGIATLPEIERAIAAAEDAGCQQLLLLHCVSGYPTPLEDCNLQTIPDLARRTGLQVGLSDHTLGSTAPVTAVALGATVIEKHITLKRTDGGPDAAFSLEPDEFKSMVNAVRDGWAALGRISYDLKESELATRRFRRSIYVTTDLPAGATISETNVRSIRPANGLSPHLLPKIIGRRTKVSIAAGTPLSLEQLEDG